MEREARKGAVARWLRHFPSARLQPDALLSKKGGPGIYTSNIFQFLRAPVITSHSSPPPLPLPSSVVACESSSLLVEKLENGNGNAQRKQKGPPRVVEKAQGKKEKFLF